MAIIHHHTRKEGEQFATKIITDFATPAEFVLANIPAGVPFTCYWGEIADCNDITADSQAMMKTGKFHIVEGAGGGGGFIGKILSPFSKFNDPLGINRRIRDAIMPDVADPSAPNRQAESPNNSLTDRNNKPRPYARVYDICGTVQSIPSDLMQGYRSFDARNREFGFNFYYISRGYVDTPASGITDGDTLLSAITGSSAAIYDPFTSPNNSAPRMTIGEPITEGLYISTRANEIDGITLRAPNELQAKVADGAIASLAGINGTITDNSADAEFDTLFKIGDVLSLVNFKVQYTVASVNYTTILDGTFSVLAVAEKFITLNVSPALSAWALIPGGSAPIINGQKPVISPTSEGAGYTDWVTISRVVPQRLLANIVATNGLYKENNDGRHTTSVTAQIQYQLLDNGNPIGAIMSASQTLSDKTGDEVGMTIVINLPTPSSVRVRARRSSNKDFEYEGSITDEVKFRDLYAQVRDLTPHYGDMTTIQTVRRNTSQATAIKEPQLKVMATEMLNKYLGGGVFAPTRTANTQAAQSLIRLMRDPIVGGLNLSSANMDDLIATQAEIEAYFGNVQAGQFCYTFDDAAATAQDIARTIASAVFCTIDRANAEGDIRLAFERPQAGPAMVFTHRSKTPGNEKWDTAFSSQKKYDSVELSYIDPKTNAKELIRIPEAGGSRPNKIDTKGIRNKYQATLLANRVRQKDRLSRVTVDFTATEEGAFVVAGQAISVVKGSRVSPFDGYIVAQNGLTLTLSQEVEFTDGDQHSILLKRRDGSAESIDVEPSPINKRTVLMLSAPSEPIYTENSAAKTEFSFGNEARHLAQMIVPATVEPANNKTVKITGYNYDPDYYLYDGGTIGGAFSDGFSDGFSN